jgi:hypothetical protein
MEEFNLLKKHFTKAKIILLPMPIMFWRFASFYRFNLPTYARVVDVTKDFLGINDLEILKCVCQFISRKDSSILYGMKCNKDRANNLTALQQVEVGIRQNFIEKSIYYYKSDF